jgi:hypothetical protein
MRMLFDNLGPEWRSPDVAEVLRQMAGEGTVERGAVFTRPEVDEYLHAICSMAIASSYHIDSMASARDQE